MQTWRIGEVLLRKKLIDWEQLEAALVEQERTREVIGEILVRRHFVPKYLFFKALAERHAMPFVDLGSVHIDKNAVSRLPKSLAIKYLLLPIEVQNDILLLAISSPVTDFPKDEIIAITKVSDIKTVLCTPESVREAIDRNYETELSNTGA